MIAKYKGTCTICGGNIPKGANINWSYGTGAMHPHCSPARFGYNPDSDDGYDAIKDARASGMTVAELRR